MKSGAYVNNWLIRDSILALLQLWVLRCQEMWKYIVDLFTIYSISSSYSVIMSDRSRSPVRERERSPVRERERSRSNSRDRERVPPPRDEAPVDTEPTKLFIGNLSFDVS